VIVAPRCGANPSESSVFGRMPAAFFVHTEFLMSRLPPAFVPE
jgi:hypothetical protein